jgi:hypothetical protein
VVCGWSAVAASVAVVYVCDLVRIMWICFHLSVWRAWKCAFLVYVRESVCELVCMCVCNVYIYIYIYIYIHEFIYIYIYIERVRVCLFV